MTFLGLRTADQMHETDRSWTTVLVRFAVPVLAIDLSPSPVRQMYSHDFALFPDMRRKRQRYYRQVVKVNALTENLSKKKIPKRKVAVN